MRIGTNVQSMIGQRALMKATGEAEASSLKMSSGDRIYTSAVDPSGLAISEKQRAKSAGLDQAKRNANDTISLLQIGEGSLHTIHELGGRLRELALQAATDTLTDRDRALANKEFQSLKSEIKRVQESVSYNGRRLSENGGSFSMQIGVNNTSSDRINFDMKKALRDLDQLGITSTSIGTKASSRQALGSIDGMIQKISASRADLGSVSFRMNSTVNNLMVDKESTESSKSQIRDTDFAYESAAHAAVSIRRDATTALLTNANNLPQKVMKLLS